jgi:hypothetical protein
MYIYIYKYININKRHLDRGLPLGAEAAVERDLPRLAQP